MSGADVATTLLFLAANVRRRRLAMQLTQESFSEHAGLDLRFFRYVEQGARDVSVSSLVRLSVALGCRPGELLNPTQLVKRKPGRPPLVTVSKRLRQKKR